jgi:hypothetical protein
MLMPRTRCAGVEECLRGTLSMGWHQVLLRSLVGSFSREFVYKLVYIRTVFSAKAPTTIAFTPPPTQLAQSATYWYCPSPRTDT